MVTCFSPMRSLGLKSYVLCFIKISVLFSYIFSQSQASLNFNKFLLLDINAEEESEENEIQTYSVSEALLLRHKLKGLYGLLSQHPTLLYRRFQVGSQRPSFPSYDTFEVFICQTCYNRCFSHETKIFQEVSFINPQKLKVLVNQLHTRNFTIKTANNSCVQSLS